MHHCLEIQEIVRNICDHMDEKTSLSLGLTCRATLVPALERIWKVIDSWEFLRSLPEASWKITLEPCNDSNECPSDQPCTRYFEPSDNDGFKPADLTRYLKHYAPKIKVLTLGEVRHGMLVPSISTLQALGRAVDKELGILSPFLKQFTWLSPDFLGYYTSNSEVMDIIPSYLMFAFVGPSVHIVRMEVNSSCDDLYIPFVNASTVSLGPTLSKLDLGTYDPDLCDLGALEGILDMAPKWNRLESLTLPTIFSVENIIDLASLPCLRYLGLELVEDVSDFGDRSKVEEAYARLALNPFPALEELAIRGPNFSEIVGFLDYLPKDNIIHSFRADSHEFNSTEDSQEMVETVRKHLHPLNLKYLQIHDGQGWDLDEPEEPLDPDELGWDDSADIACLLEFQSLVLLAVALRRGVHISCESDHITWPPELETLRIIPSSPLVAPSPWDHTQVLEICRACRSLVELTISFDTSRIRKRTTPVPNDIFPSVKYLNVDESFIVFPQRVAAFIEGHFPGLQRFATAHPKLCHNRFRFRADHTERTLIDRRWNLVKSIMNYA